MIATAAEPIFDAHHHLWDGSPSRFPWMVGEHAALRRHFGPEDLAAAIGDLPIEGTVCVQAAAEEAETVELLAEAESRTAPIEGVVGWLDLLDPDVSGAVARLRSAPGGQRLVGIRPQAEDEADPGWLARPAVVAGAGQVVKEGLVFELLVRERELPAALELAQGVDGGTLVIDHAAKPPIAEGRFQPWSERLAQMARLPHVLCKLSGLLTEAGRGWGRGQIDPYLERALELFGPKRLMLGSDWPVCTLRASYREAIESVTVPLGALLSPSERAMVWHQNARRAYRLAPQPEGEGS